MKYLFAFLIFGCAEAFDPEYSQESFASIRSSEFSLGVPSFLRQSNVFRLLKAPTGVTIRLDNCFLDMVVCANVSFGTPPQYALLFPENRYTDVMVTSKKCDGCGGGYNSNVSSTYVADGRPVNFPDGTGKTLKGILSIDTVCAGGVCAKSQSFVEILGYQRYQHHKFTAGQFYGALGLGRQSQASLNTSSFLKTLVDEKLIPKQLFGFWLNRTESTYNKGYKLNGGELHLGQIKTEKFVEPINWVPTANNKSWEIRVDQISSGDSNITCVNGCNVQLELAFPAILGPAKEIEAINKFIGATREEEKDPIYMISCEKITSLPEITFLFGEKKLTLKGIDYTGQMLGLCYSLFEPNREEPNVWILGQPVLGSYYSIFDDEEGRFGFAQLKNPKDLDGTSWSWVKIVVIVVLLLASLSAVVTLLWCCLYKCFCAPNSRYNYREFS